MTVVVRAARALLLFAALMAISRVAADAGTVLLHADMVHTMMEVFIGDVKFRSPPLLSAAACVLSMMYHAVAGISILI